MEPYLIDETRKLHICGNNPDCAGFEIETGEFKLKGYDGPTLECDKCGAEMQLKTGRFGKYFGCTAEGCKNTRKLLRNGEPAPPKADPIPMPDLRCEKVDDFYLLRDGASGLFLRGTFPFPLAQNASSAASHTCRRPAARRLLLRAAVTTEHGHLGRSSGASQRLGRASFTHAATTEMSGPSVEP